MAVELESFASRRGWESPGASIPFPHLAITQGAFPEQNEARLGRYLYDAANVSDPTLARVLRFAALCILEPISYTRKDGQYLRWDHRSGRRAGVKRFDKGYIADFSDAIIAKIHEIANDLCLSDRTLNLRPSLFDVVNPSLSRGNVELLQGSCLDILPTLPDASFDGLVTSPPYCNRYDYTRTYALELAMLEVGEHGIRDLRQMMLSCTVENRDKDHLSGQYPMDLFGAASEAWQSQEVLSLVLAYLDACRQEGNINNPGIPRMIKNYFAEMALVIFESARILKPGAPLIMVNDNVRYQGAHIPVDLILSDIAQRAGFAIDTIWVLPRGKGNSSQQMSVHGRAEVRKCVYVWRRTTAEPASQPDRPLAAIW